MSSTSARPSPLRRHSRKQLNSNCRGNGTNLQLWDAVYTVGITCSFCVTTRFAQSNAIPVPLKPFILVFVHMMFPWSSSHGFFFSTPKYRMLWRTLMVSSKCTEFPVFSSRLDGSLKGKTDFEVGDDMALFGDCWTLRLIRLLRIPEAHDGNSNDSKATDTEQKGSKWYTQGSSMQLGQGMFLYYLEDTRGKFSVAEQTNRMERHHWRREIYCRTCEGMSEYSIKDTGSPSYASVDLNVRMSDYIRSHLLYQAVQRTPL